MVKHLSQFIAFAGVARHLSFARASKELGLAPSSVAKSVARLEAKMGTRLFVRTTRSVQLTADGEELYRRCTQLLAQIQELEQLTDKQSDQPAGLLRISAPVGYGGKVLIPIVARLLSRYPELRVDLRLTDERVDLAGEGLDAAIRFGQLPDSSLIAREVSRQPLLLCASPAYLRQHSPLANPLDIERHDVIAFRMPDSGRDRPLEFLVKGQSVRARYTPRLWLSQGSALVDAMLADCGIAQVPQFMVADLIAAGRLSEVLPSYRPQALSVNLVTTGGRALVPRLKVLLDALKSG